MLSPSVTGCSLVDTVVHSIGLHTVTPEATVYNWKISKTLVNNNFNT